MKLVWRVIVFYILMWFFLVLLGGIQQETGILPPEIGLAQLAPGMAGMMMLLLFRKDGHKITFFSKSRSARHYLIAVGVPITVGVITAVILPLVSKAKPGAGGVSLAAVLWAPVGALGEEIGWRGYLQKRLHGNMRGMLSAVLVGLLWAPMHVHFFANGLLFFALFLLLIISYSIFIYVISSDEFNVLLAAVFHLAVNYVNLFFYDAVNAIAFMAVSAVLWIVVAEIAILINKKKLIGTE